MKPLEKVTALDSGQVRLNAFRRSGAFGNGIDFMLQDEYLLNDALHGWRRQQPQIFSAGHLLSRDSRRVVLCTQQRAVWPRVFIDEAAAGRVDSEQDNLMHNAVAVVHAHG
jgi:hypothetical protein